MKKNKTFLTKIGTPLFSFDSVTSTNDIAKKLAELDFPEGTAAMAGRQTKGRGRLERKWISPDGENIYVSIVLRPKINCNDIPFLSILGAVGVAKTIKEFYKGQVLIKWPNDVLVKEKKISGILSELKTNADNVEHVIMGIGVNLNSSLKNFDEDLKKISISLSIATGKKANRELFLEKLFENLKKLYKDYQKGIKTKILKMANDILFKKNKTVSIAVGDKTIKAVIKEINNDGSLRLIKDGTRFDCINGEIVK